jgi:hypothetical protein
MYPRGIGGRFRVHGSTVQRLKKRAAGSRFNGSRVKELRGSGFNGFTVEEHPLNR